MRGLYFAQEVDRKNYEINCGKGNSSHTESACLDDVKRGYLSGADANLYPIVDHAHMNMWKSETTNVLDIAFFVIERKWYGHSSKIY